MSLQTQIETQLREALSPMHLEVINESHMHNVPQGSESHFKVTVVTEAFIGKPLIQRHRAVNKAIGEAFQGQLHALALHTMTPEEWFEKGGKVPDSPLCQGGSKG